MPQMMALGVQSPNIDALGSFREGMAGAAGMDRAKKEAAEKSLQLIGSASMHALGGDINGQADPQRYEEGLNMLSDMGIDVEKFRGKPHLANAAARASVSTMHQLQMAQDDRQFEFLMEKFAHDVMDSDRNFGLAQQQEQRLAGGNVPAGYERTEDGMTFIPGGPADPGNPLNTRKVTGPSLSVTAQKELFEADEAVSSGRAVLSALDQAIELNEKAYTGPTAGVRGYGASLLGIEGGAETEELTNLITTQALDQLKATFGSMPTEGERKVLLEIQGSVSKSPDVRKKIFERAKVMAERRMEFNRQKAAQLRSGEYFSEGPGDPAPTMGDTGAGPQPGSVEDGYRFIGGDPANPASWEPVN
jgi:hypothetical protein